VAVTWTHNENLCAQYLKSKYWVYIEKIVKMTLLTCTLVLTLKICLVFMVIHRNGVLASTLRIPMTRIKSSELEKPLCNAPSEELNLKPKNVDQNKIFLEFNIRWFFKKECQLDPEEFKKYSVHFLNGAVKTVCGWIVGKVNRLPPQKSKNYQEVVSICQKNEFKKLLNVETEMEKRLNELNPVKPTITTSATNTTASTTTIVTTKTSSEKIETKSD